MGSIPLNTEEIKVGSDSATPTKKPLQIEEVFLFEFSFYSSTQLKTFAYSVGSNAL